MNQELQVKLNIDKYGMSTTVQGDGYFGGGDSAANMGTLFFCLPNEKLRYVHAMNQLEVSYGTFIRHPDKSMWYSRPNTMSRDQMIPLLCAMMRYKDKKRARRFAAVHATRLFLFMTNTRRNGQYPSLAEQLAKSPNKPWDYSWKIPDPTGPEFWGLMIRACQFWFLYPLLLIFDLETLFAAIIRRIQFSMGTMDRDSRNMILAIMASNDFYPTPWSRLSARVYKKTDPLAQVGYWFGERKGNANLNLVLEPLIKVHF